MDRHVQESCLTLRSRSLRRGAASRARGKRLTRCIGIGADQQDGGTKSSGTMNRVQWRLDTMVVARSNQAWGIRKIVSDP